ncbi:MAG: ribonuclease Y [Campylobacterales bacterium]|nr:ribonuclease Y [Campylobacterales bacterium]
MAWFATKNYHTKRYDFFLKSSKAKAKAIESEAKKILADAKKTVRDQENELKKEFEIESRRLKKEYNQKLSNIEHKEEKLEAHYAGEKKHIDALKKENKSKESKLNKEKSKLQNLVKAYETKNNDATSLLAKVTGLTEEEAKEELLSRVENSARSEMSNIIRKYESQAKNEAKKRANFILAQATTRFAGDFTSERLTNIVHFSNDEYKGRIIGKEGRNIKALEHVLGVDIIIDDTPGAIIVSSFNLYRRAIAVKTIEILVEDGRIQPARIEDVYEKVKSEFEDSLMEDGQNIILDLGVGDMAPELVKLVGKLKYRASYGQNALSHSLEVAYLAGLIAADLGGDPKLAKRAGLLHDIGKSLTHDFEGSHVDLGGDLCKRYKEAPEVINGIYAHHGHEEATSIEAAAVCTADVLSAARPGARREVLESYLKRVKQIEEIATSIMGVNAAYAVNAGREVRVIVNAEMVCDNESCLIAKEIADEIAANVQFPGEIKVNVIREIRSVEFAK